MTTIESIFAPLLRSPIEPILVPMLGGPDQGVGPVAAIRKSLERIAEWDESPQSFFEACLVLILVPAVILFFHHNVQLRPKKPKFASETLFKENKPDAIRTFQKFYLPVFWLMRMAFWMSGPYFFPVYASKIIDGQPASVGFISQIFNFGFAAAALFLPPIASIVSASYTDERTGTIAAAVFYALGALSTTSSSAWVLFAGRAMGNIGAGLMAVMPEAWLSSEVQKCGADPYGRWLSGTFGFAYSADSIVAISAGQLASFAASQAGPTGPFMVSPFFLAIAVLVTYLFWTDSDVPEEGAESDANNGLSIKSAIDIIRSDSKIMMVGLVQCTFEASMYIFVLQQAPAMSKALAKFFGEDSASTPSGLVFCCFMACCLMGSTLYGMLSELSVLRTEKMMTVVVACAACALISASFTVSGDMGLLQLAAAFFAFEVCVGMYFPMISWMRSKYLPVKHRSVIMTLITVPFNVLVLTISMSTQIIGVTGAWAIASALLLLSALCLIRLQVIARREAIENLPKTWKRIKVKWMSIARVFQIRKLVQGLATQSKKEGY